MTRGCNYVTAGAPPNVTSYSLTLNSSSLQPCRRHVDVFYAAAGCPSAATRAAVRLYRQETDRSPADDPTPRAAVPARRVYVAERPAPGCGGVVRFHCRLFDADYLYYYDAADDDVIVVGYCFRFVDVAPNGSIAERLERCLPLSPSGQGLYICKIITLLISSLYTIFIFIHRKRYSNDTMQINNGKKNNKVCACDSRRRLE